ncbi:MAG: hypothetical protein WC943_04125 [Elusimicrobiota bacterium]|jgi:hypothetical protein
MRMSLRQSRSRTEDWTGSVLSMPGTGPPVMGAASPLPESLSNNPLRWASK